MNIIDIKYGSVLPPQVKYFFIQKIKKYSIYYKMELSTYYTIHRYIMIVAFIILLPIGICMPIFKKKIGNNWYTYHKHIMLSVLILSFIGICISLYAKDLEGESNVHPLSTFHGLIGIFLVILVLCNIAWAIIMRRSTLLSHSKWLAGHRIFALLIITSILINAYLGYSIYKDRFRTTKSRHNVAALHGSHVHSSSPNKDTIIQTGKNEVLILNNETPTQ